MNKPDDHLFLQHILDAIERIETYLEGVERERFDTFPMLQDAVIRQLQVIGEAVRRLSAELRTNYPTVPWKMITGMRNKLVHDYFGIDLDAVWLTAQRDLPDLKSWVTTMIGGTPEESRGP
jgi:uncharacterized protein with HEPN domain